MFFCKLEGQIGTKMVKNKKKLKKVIIYSNFLFLQVDFLNFP